MDIEHVAGETVVAPLVGFQHKVFRVVAHVSRNLLGPRGDTVEVVINLSGFRVDILIGRFVAGLQNLGVDDQSIVPQEGQQLVLVYGLLTFEESLDARPLNLLSLDTLTTQHRYDGSRAKLITLVTDNLLHQLGVHGIGVLRQVVTHIGILGGVEVICVLDLVRLEDHNNGGLFILQTVLACVL